jgi:nucleotide-binding universal stress UspA family protein
LPDAEAHQQTGNHQEGIMFKRILCATDGSEHGDRAVRQAARMALADDAELHLAHVIERIPGGGRLAGQHVFLTESEIDARIVRQGEELAQQEGVIAEVHLVRGAGHPAKQLAELAGRIDADLIVLGSRGHSPLAGVVLGSVTHQLVHAAGRPVLAVPPAHAALRRPVPPPAALRAQLEKPVKFVR